MRAPCQVVLVLVLVVVVWLVVVLPLLLPIGYAQVRQLIRICRSPLSDDDRLFHIQPQPTTVAQAPDALIAANLRTAELAARRLSARVTSVSMQVGGISVLLMAMPTLCNSLVGTEDYLVWAANGGSHFVAFGLAQVPCTPPTAHALE